MGILDPLRRFATGTAVVFGFAAGPKRGSLFGEQAIDTLTDSLFGFADPDEVLRKAGLSRANLRVLEGDDEITAAMETRLAAVQCTPMRLEPYDDAARFVEAELAPLLESAMTGAWNAVAYGYSVMEAVYVRRPDGRVGLAQITEKPFEWFEPGRGGTLRYFGNTFARGGEVVDTRLKFFLTVHRYSYRNPRGEALLSRAYWPWFLRSAGWRFFARFVERHAGPLLVGKTNGDKNAMADALAAAVQSGSLAVNKEDDVAAFSPGDGGSGFERFIDLSNRRIQKLILGQTLTTEAGKAGSYALGKVHDQVRADRRVADLRMVRGTLQRIVDALCAVNGMKAPTVVLDAGRDLQADRAERDAKLVAAKIVKLTPKYLRDRYDFDDGDFEVPAEALEPAVEPGKAVANIGAKAAAQFAARGRPGRFTADQEAIESLGDEAIDLAGDPIDPARIRAVVREASDPDDLIERLAALFDTLPPVQYREAMERALFAADVLGYAHASEGVDQGA